MAIFVSRFIILFNIASFLLLSAFSLAEVEIQGFSVDLISKGSLISPKTHNSSLSHQDHVNNAILRSKSRANRFTFRSLLTSGKGMIAPDGDFLMKLSIGTPPSEIIGLADTGGDFSWIQCAPCDHCYLQKPPLFTPKKSSTYKQLPGNSNLCKSLGGRASILGENTCRYALSYWDDSYSHGVIATDTITLHSTSAGSSVSKRNIVFGCGSENQGPFNEESSGVIGLGAGPASLITQMKDVIGGKFSYCLVPHTKHNSKPSQMHFGSKASVSGAGTVSTGLQIFKNSLYALKFIGLSVGNKKLATPNDISSKILGFFSDMITIESGSILTYLPRKYYNPLESAMKKEIKLPQTVHPKGKLKVCYKTKNDDFKTPIVTVHFVGADVKLNSTHTFIKVAENVQCLGIVPHVGLAILGNLAQRNFLVGYDLNKKIVSFKPVDCSKT